MSVDHTFSKVIAFSIMIGVIIFLVGDNLGVLATTKAQGHDKDPGFDNHTRKYVRDRRPGAKIDLGRLTRIEIDYTGCFRGVARIF